MSRDPVLNQSAFTPSPEDLIAKAQQGLEDGSIAGTKTVMLVHALCVELRKERENRASQMAMVRASNISEGKLRDANTTLIARLKHETPTFEEWVGRVMLVVWVLSVGFFLWKRP